MVLSWRVCTDRSPTWNTARETGHVDEKDARGRRELAKSAGSVLSLLSVLSDVPAHADDVSAGDGGRAVVTAAKRGG